MSNNIYIKLILLCFCIVFSFNYNLWGSGQVDECYWINKSFFYHSSIMTTLSLFSINKILLFTGYSQLAFRVLAWSLNILSLILPYILLIKKNDWARYLNYLSASILIMGAGISKICGPDVFTSISITLLTISVIIYTNKDGKKWLLIICLISAINIAFRFPNIVCIPLVALFLLLSANNRRDSIIIPFLYTVLTLILYYIIIYFITGKGDIVGILSNELTAASSGNNERHSMIGLLLRYAKSILLSFVVVLILFLSYFISSKLKTITKILNVTVFISISLVLLFFYLIITDKQFFWMPVIGPFVSLLFIFLIYHELKYKRYDLIRIYLFLSMIIFIPSAGSDTGFAKSIICASSLIPIAIVYLSKYNYRNIYISSIIWICAITSSFIFMYDVIYCDMFAKEGFSQGIYSESWVYHSDIKRQKDLITYFKKDKMVFYGWDAHTMYCQTQSRPIYNYPYWMEANDNIAIYKAIDAMHRNPEFVFIDFTNSDKSYFLKRGMHLVAAKDKIKVYSY